MDISKEHANYSTTLRQKITKLKEYQFGFSSNPEWINPVGHKQHNHSVERKVTWYWLRWARCLLSYKLVCKIHSKRKWYDVLVFIFIHIYSNKYNSIYSLLDKMEKMEQGSIMLIAHYIIQIKAIILVSQASVLMASLACGRRVKRCKIWCTTHFKSK